MFEFFKLSRNDLKKSREMMDLQSNSSESSNDSDCSEQQPSSSSESSDGTVKTNFKVTYIIFNKKIKTLSQKYKKMARFHVGGKYSYAVEK